MKKKEEEIRRLAKVLRIAESYFNIKGERVEVSLETVIHIIRAMGIDSVEEALSQIQERKYRPPVIVSRERRISLPVPPGWEDGEVSIRNENQEVVRYGFSGLRILLQLPKETPWGYYSVEVNSKKDHFTTLWVFSPLRAFIPAGRFWGFTGALYSFTTSRNQGIGDLEDLHRIAEILAQQGAKFLGLLPLHLLEKEEPHGVSPYFPLDRLSWEPLYLPLDILKTIFHPLPIVWKEDLFSLEKEVPFISYKTLWEKKEQILWQIFEAFLANRGTFSKQWETFETFWKARGERLRWSSFFQAFARQEGNNWQKWPPEIRTKQERAIEEEMAKREKEILYYAFLQWLMEEKLQKVNEHFPILGFDLPVGSSPYGIESWIEQEKMVFDCTIGAPPDDFAPLGQNWGLPPLNPWKERESFYRHFIALLRFNLRFARFLRIDHIMGLQRLFWIPRGAHPKEGTYVYQPFAELLAILTLESHRHKVTIIGEDLGTVPITVRKAMEKAGILSTRVFFFEKDQFQKPFLPSSYPVLGFVTPNTHDMPPLRAFLTRKDLQTREQLGIFTPEMVRIHSYERELFLKQLLALWKEWGWITTETLSPETFLENLIRFLSCTPSLVVAFSLDDLLGSDKQPNLPGTLHEFPNWRHRLFIPDDFPERVKKFREIFQRDSRVI